MTDDETRTNETDSDEADTALELAARLEELLTYFDLVDEELEDAEASRVLGVVMRAGQPERIAIDGGGFEGTSRHAVISGLGLPPAELEAALAAQDAETMLFDDLTEALCGLTDRGDGVLIAVYDNARCIELRAERDGMGEEGAVEFHEFNTASAWAGEGTPCLLMRP